MCRSESKLENLFKTDSESFMMENSVGAESELNSMELFFSSLKEMDDSFSSFWSLPKIKISNAEFLMFMTKIRESRQFGMLNSDLLSITTVVESSLWVSFDFVAESWLISCLTLESSLSTILSLQP
ncbi:hypothetical protein OGAPHI_007256 [Ogataea philodendri]|uniref:Uncharacterized protein n=1 Tax=Ogataea philodendri TaxID=1378263 RepID=A0A9P8SZZ3_9ASCO|nr:uncharacterized protein OGAPHI_007256 [Ogataea philodendri]KAH3660051.1 hypothetical protein OGAPHI_007256 [Ogataea philodendri]